MIALACDHGGFDLMSKVKKFLSSKKLAFEDFGTFSMESCDYPVLAKRAAASILSGKCSKGIFICTTGIGMSIVANKIPGIRAALCTNVYMAAMTRSHNDANVLCLGAKVTDTDLSIEIVDVFLSTDFCGEQKHVRRVDMLEYEE